MFFSSRSRSSGSNCPFNNLFIGISQMFAVIFCTAFSAVIPKEKNNVGILLSTAIFLATVNANDVLPIAGRLAIVITSPF
jgi:hypothetical protein